MTRTSDIIAEALRTHGPVNALRYAAHFAADYVYDRLCDWRLGIKTATYIPHTHLGYDDPSYHMHLASGYRGFRKVMNYLDVEPGRDVFLDYGSGTGRMLIMAGMMHEFGKIIGVELNSQMRRVARRNISRFNGKLKCDNIEIINANAADYRLPDEVTVVYFYNPFSGHVLAGALDNIERSLRRRSRKITVLCKSPDNFERAAQKRPWLDRIAQYGCFSTYRYVVYKAEL